MPLVRPQLSYLVIILLPLEQPAKHGSEQAPPRVDSAVPASSVYTPLAQVIRATGRMCFACCEHFDDGKLLHDGQMGKAKP